MIDYKKLVESLSDENISKRDYDNALKKIEKRVHVVWRSICHLSNRKLVWWAFRNDMDLGNGNGSTGGCFDPAFDSEFIEIIGENTRYKSDYYDYNYGFPTAFLWENYEPVVIAHLEDCKKKDQAASQKNKREARKVQIEALKTKLNSVLTKEELRLISFKKP